MFGRKPHRAAARAWDVLPGLLLVALSLLTVVWLSPGMPYPDQDSAWVLALNQAVADRLAFGRDVIYPLGPWADVYAGQYHPATDGMMLAGGAVVALALAGGLLALARGGGRWFVLLAPLLVATVGARDPVFMATPLLLLAVAVAAARPAALDPPDGRRGGRRAAALLLLAVSCALLSLVKSTFGTEVAPMVGLAALALLSGRRFRLAGLMLACFAASLAGFWLLAGQRLVDFPAYLATRSVVIGGYSEGLALDGPASDIVAYLCACAALLGLLRRGRGPGDRGGAALLALGLLLTLFVAFKSGFVRHDEHALIAAGTLAMTPVVLVAALRPLRLAAATLVALCALAVVSRNHPGLEWPSFAAGRDRVASAATGAWARMADPGLLRRQFDAAMAAVRADAPLPRVAGPTDIYSSGQMILLANGLQWSPRPALQSVTVLGEALARADLDHLEGAGGRRPPVQNVFYRVESEDNRLRSTEDGLSWPALLTEFRVEGYDRALDTAQLRRLPGARAAAPGSVLLDGRHLLGEDVALPASGTGLAWATLDVRPTLLGRLADLLFRPPLLSIAIRYADGSSGRFRLVSALARGGFLLTPRVLDTEEMLSLLLPEHRAPAERPVSISVDAEGGARWSWQKRFDLKLRSMDIPVQEQVRAMLLPSPLTPAPAPGPGPAAEADACAIELVDGRPASSRPVEVRGVAEVSGWSVVSVARGEAPDRVLVRLTDAEGRSWETVAQPRPRRDVSGYFVNPALTETGFYARFDVSALSGAYTLTVLGERGDSARRCRTTQDLLVLAPERSPP